MFTTVVDPVQECKIDNRYDLQLLEGIIGSGTYLVIGHHVCA